MDANALLICDVSEGMFPEERSVSFQASDGCKIELFVTDRRIRDNKLEIRILEEKNGLSLIELPAEPLNESAVLTVRSDIIRKPITA